MSPDSVADRLVDNGTSLDNAREAVLAIVLTRGAGQQSLSNYGNETRDYFGGEIGLTTRESGEFSVVRAINALISGDWRQAGFERAASEAQSRQLGRSSPGFFIPGEVLKRGEWNQRSAYSTGAAGTGGNIVATNLMADAFIEALRNQAQVLQAGATVLTGLVGNVDIPRQASVTNTYWVTESQGITEAEATFDKISLKPHTIGALSKMSRLMLMQSTPAIEMLVRADLIAQLGLGIDLAALSGPGSGGAPLGIMGTSGVGHVIGGTDGAAVTLDHLLALEAILNSNNAPVASRSYIMNGLTIAALKKLKSTTGQYLWTTDAPGQRSGTPGSINGYPALASNQLRSTLSRGASSGICSELIFGAWADLVFAEWGTLEVVANPFDATGFPAGDVLIRTMQSVDIGVRHPASFAFMNDALVA
jgi:HK97 family phage major capsid protein